MSVWDDIQEIAEEEVRDTPGYNLSGYDSWKTRSPYEADGPEPLRSYDRCPCCKRLATLHHIPKDVGEACWDCIQAKAITNVACVACDTAFFVPKQKLGEPYMCHRCLEDLNRFLEIDAQIAESDERQG